MWTPLLVAAVALAFWPVDSRASDPIAGEGLCFQPSCSAREVARFNGTSWVCENDGIHDERARLPELLDANGNVVGAIVDSGAYVTSGRVATVLAVQNSACEPKSVLAHFNKNRVAAQSTSLYFEAGDCSGTPLVPAYGTIEGLYDFSSVFYDAAKRVNMLYVAAGPIIEGAEIHSHLKFEFSSSSGNLESVCDDNSQVPITIDAYPMELIDNDLSLTYPPPYYARRP